LEPAGLNFLRSGLFFMKFLGIALLFEPPFNPSSSAIRVRRKIVFIAIVV
jgi:hypothetical protein